MPSFIEGIFMGKVTNHELFVESMLTVNPTITVIGKWTCSSLKVLVKCSKCGHGWESTPNNLLGGRKCPACVRFKTHSEFAKELVEKNQKVTLEGKYVDVKTKVEVRCKICGKPLLIRPDSLLEGRGCTTCANRSRRLGSAELIGAIKSIHVSLELLEIPETVKQRVSCLCNKCGREWKPRVSKLLEGMGCRVCFLSSMTKNHSKFVDDCHKVNPDIEVLGEYVRCKDRILVKCKIDGYEWETYPNDILSGYGCSMCSKSGFNVGREAEFYIYEFEDTFGFGISNNPTKRHRTHRKTFKNHEISATLFKTFHGIGREIQELEKMIKQLLICHNMGIDGFKTEAIHKSEFEKLDVMIQTAVLQGRIKEGLLPNVTGDRRKL